MFIPLKHNLFSRACCDLQISCPPHFTGLQLVFKKLIKIELSQGQIQNFVIVWPKRSREHTDRGGMIEFLQDIVKLYFNSYTHPHTQQTFKIYT